MRVRVRLFSLLRERAGTAETELELSTGATVAQALGELGRKHPPLGPILSGGSLPLLYAVNREYAGTAVRLRDGDEVAVFPPVSGGTGPTVGSPREEVGVPSAPSHGLLLLSGGFDSPVAGYLVRSAGRRLAAVHYTFEPYTDDASAHKARKLAARLGLERLWIVPLGADLGELTRRCNPRLYFVLLKRLMLRVAHEIALRERAEFLVTGENLGQVSSQTLPNLAVIDEAATLPVLRPLLGFDKTEILRVARAIGTFETSVGPELCDVLGPRHPRTRSTLPEVFAEEAKLDLGALVSSAMARAKAVEMADSATLPGLSAPRGGGA